VNRLTIRQKYNPQVLSTHFRNLHPPLYTTICLNDFLIPPTRWMPSRLDFLGVPEHGIRGHSSRSRSGKFILLMRVEAGSPKNSGTGSKTKPETGAEFILFPRFQHRNSVLDRRHGNRLEYSPSNK
jgi:hypothetical protein